MNLKCNVAFTSVFYQYIKIALILTTAICFIISCENVIYMSYLPFIINGKGSSNVMFYKRYIKMNYTPSPHFIVNKLK